MARPHLLLLPALAALCLASSPAPTEVRFTELFALPVGRRGLEPTEKLRALDGQRVRIQGWVVAQDAPLPGRFLLTETPAHLHEDESGQADDLPGATVFVFLTDDPDSVVVPGAAPLRLTGTLDVGPRLEADGRRSFVRLHVKKNPKETKADAEAHP
jgi:hypothetical protein